MEHVIEEASLQRGSGSYCLRYSNHSKGQGVSALVLNHKIEPSVGAIAVLAGLTTNTVTKIVAAFTTGGREFALPVLAGLSAIILAAWLGLLFSNLA